MKFRYAYPVTPLLSIMCHNPFMITKVTYLLYFKVQFISIDSLVPIFGAFLIYCIFLIHFHPGESGSNLTANATELLATIMSHCEGINQNFTNLTCKLLVDYNV